MWFLLELMGNRLPSLVTEWGECVSGMLCTHFSYHMGKTCLLLEEENQISTKRAAETTCRPGLYDFWTPRSTHSRGQTIPAFSCFMKAKKKKSSVLPKLIWWKFLTLETKRVVLFHLWRYFSLLAWIINSCMLRIFQVNNDLVKANRKSKGRFKFNMHFQGKYYTNHMQYLKISFSFRLCCGKNTLRWKKIYKIYEKI